MPRPALQLCPVYANVAAQDLLAFSLKKARGRPFSELLHEPEGLAGILRRSLASGEISPWVAKATVQPGAWFGQTEPAVLVD